MLGPSSPLGSSTRRPSPDNFRGLALDWSNSYARRRWRQQQEVGRAILLVSRIRVRLAAEPLLPVLGLDRRRYTSARDGDAHAGHLQVKPSCGDPPLTSTLLLGAPATLAAAGPSALPSRTGQGAPAKPPASGLSVGQGAPAEPPASGRSAARSCAAQAALAKPPASGSRVLKSGNARGRRG